MSTFMIILTHFETFVRDTPLPPPPHDYVANDVRQLNIKSKIFFLDNKVSITINDDEYDSADNSGKGICNTISIETNSFGTSTLPVPTARRPVYVPCYTRRFLPAAIYNNLLLVKAYADYIITNITDNTHVNFRQSEHFICTKFNFYV